MGEGRTSRSEGSVAKILRTRAHQQSVRLGAAMFCISIPVAYTMSLLSHCDPTITTECICRVVARVPEYATVFLFLLPFFYYDIVFFWLSFELLLNYFVNILLNMFVHPHDVTKVIFGTAGFLGYPSFQAQFAINLSTVVILFQHLFRLHIPGWIFVMFYTIIIAVLFACVYLAHEEFGAIYVGSAIGWAIGVVSVWFFTVYLEQHSNFICFSKFGNWNGLRNSYAVRHHLEHPATHERMDRIMEAGQFANHKDAVQWIFTFNGMADELDSDPTYIERRRARV